MSTSTRSPNAPTHELFAVRETKGEGKDHWQKVGSCWQHEDGDGFNVKLDYLPLDGSKLVIRKWQDPVHRQ
jgi:hypothetical protein